MNGKKDTVGKLILHNEPRAESHRVATVTIEQLRGNKQRGQASSGIFTPDKRSITGMYDRSFAGIVVDKSRVSARPIFQRVREINTPEPSLINSHRTEYCSLFRYPFVKKYY